MKENRCWFEHDKESSGGHTLKCRNGPKCEYFKKDRCLYHHNEEAKEEDGLSKYRDKTDERDKRTKKEETNQHDDNKRDDDDDDDDDIFYLGQLIYSRCKY